MTTTYTWVTPGKPIHAVLLNKQGIITAAPSAHSGARQNWHFWVSQQWFMTHATNRWSQWTSDLVSLQRKDTVKMCTNPFQTCSLIHLTTVHPFGYDASVRFLQISCQSTLYLTMLSQLFPICLHIITLALLSTKNRKYTIIFMCIYICTRHGSRINRMWVVLKLLCPIVIESC